MLNLVDSADRTYPELNDVPMQEEWLGMLRMIQPGDTDLGWIVFDVPKTSYLLRVSDGAVEDEHVGYIDIPYTLG